MTSNRARALVGAVLLSAALAGGCGEEQPPPPQPAPAAQAPKARNQPKLPKNMPPGGNKME